MIPNTILVPRSKTKAVKISPTMPVNIPIIAIRPSLPSIPNDISKIPNEGKRLVSGKGRAMARENRNANKPIILAPVSSVTASRRCRKTVSIFFIIGELLIMNSAINDLLIVFFRIHFGSHGYFIPSNNCTEKISSGMAKSVVRPGM